MFPFWGNVSWASYEVRGECAAPSLFFLGGEVEKEKCEDKVTYVIDPEQGIITRTFVESGGGGSQQDNSQYQIVEDEVRLITRDGGKGKQQRLIKAIGQVSVLGAYEIVVIGEDFITTAKSAMDYFTLYYYKRVN